MSRKNVLKPFQLVTNGDMSGNITSDTVNSRYQDNIGIQLIWTGTPVGEFFVDASIDGLTWEPLDFGASITPGGAAGDHLISINQFPYEKFRVRYVFSSSTGVLNVHVMSKEI